MVIELIPSLLWSVAHDCLEYFYRGDWDNRSSYSTLADYCDFFAHRLEEDPMARASWEDFQKYVKQGEYPSRRLMETPEIPETRVERILGLLRPVLRWVPIATLAIGIGLVLRLCGVL